jgi:hypothetical protein
MEDVGIFVWPFCLYYGQMVYFSAIGYILWSFVYFSSFGMLYGEKSGNPDLTDVRFFQGDQMRF